MEKIGYMKIEKVINLRGNGVFQNICGVQHYFNKKNFVTFDKFQYLAPHNYILWLNKYGVSSANMVKKQ